MHSPTPQSAHQVLTLEPENLLFFPVHTEHLSLLFSGIYSMKCLAVSLTVRSNDLRPGCACPSLNSPSSPLIISCWNLKWSIYF